MTGVSGRKPAGLIQPSRPGWDIQSAAELTRLADRQGFYPHEYEGSRNDD
jgi:hypothetical protein